jgi:hypothetical protein
MTTDPFDSPQTDQWKAGNYNGRLHLITPTEYLQSLKTVNGETDAVDAKIVVINEKDPASSEEFDSARIFGGFLVSSTKGKINKGMVLARLIQGEKQPGKNPPWLFADPTEDDKVAARAYLASKAPQL